MGILSSARDVVTSKTTRRAIVKLTLLAGSSLALLFLAIIATAVFFASYIPDKSLTWPVYLQYGGASDNPFGVARVTPPLPKTEQQYDISVTVTLPESPRNTDRGNFMIALHLLDTDLSPAVDLVHPPESGRSLIDPQSVILTARRPALMPYVDPAASLARRVALLPFHVLLPRKNAYSMTVPLAEGVIFPRSSKVPRSVYVELQAGQDLQTYDVSLTMTANLQGLRWILHNYSVLSFVTLTLGFWSMEMLFAGVALIVLGVLYGGQGPTAPELTVKEEDKEGEELGKVEVEERVAIQPTIKREHEHEHRHEHGLELEPGRASDAEVERKEGRHGLRRRRIKHEEGESLGSDVKDEVDIKSEPESD